MTMSYVIELTKVGPDEFSGWTRHGNYIVGKRGDRFVAAFIDRKGAQQILGRFDSVRDAKIAAQSHVATKGR